MKIGGARGKCPVNGLEVIMKIKLLSIALLVVLTTTSIPVDGAGLPPHVESSVDDADSIAEASLQAVTTLSSIIKAKQSEALKVSDNGLVAINELNLHVVKIRHSLDETKRLENQAAIDAEFAKESAAHSENIRNAISDFLRKVAEMADAQSSKEVVSQVAKSREHALTLVNLIHQNDRPAISTQLQKNVAVTNLSIVDVRSDAGATVKFSVGRIINCLSVKATCGSKTHTVTLNATLIVPKSELNNALELAVSKVRTLVDLLKELESIRNTRTMTSDAFRKFDEASQQLMNALASLIKALAEARAAISVGL